MSKELNLLGIGILAGGILAILFDFLRAFRRGCRHKTCWVSFEDMTYWIFAAVFLFFLLEKYNKGVLRFYLVLGTAMGGFFYCLVFHSLCFSCFFFLFQVVNKIFSFCGKIGQKIRLFVKKMLILPLKNVAKKITIMMRHV